jgi:hypothetical protein
MTDERSGKGGKDRNISPIVRAFMHVALLRRLGTAQTEDERQRYIEEFMAIREERPAREYVARVRAEARAQDQLERSRRARKPRPMRD